MSDVVIMLICVALLCVLHVLIKLQVALARFNKPCTYLYHRMYGVVSGLKGLTCPMCRR